MNILENFINEHKFLKKLSLVNSSLYDKYVRNILKILNENKNLEVLDLENIMLNSKISAFIPDLLQKRSINIKYNYEDKIKWYRNPIQNFKCTNTLIGQSNKLLHYYSLKTVRWFLDHKIELSKYDIRMISSNLQIY